MTTTVTEMTLASGDSRPITRFFADGAFNCPWCGAACPAGATRCENPMCLASKYWTAEQVRVELDRRAQREAEHNARVRREQVAADLATAARKAREQKWAELAQQAEENGACVTCLRRSHWEFEPKFVKHRKADFHVNDRSRR